MMHNPPIPGDVAPNGAVAIACGTIVDGVIVPAAGVLWTGRRSGQTLVSTDWTSFTAPAAAQKPTPMIRFVRDPTGKMIYRWLALLAVPSTPASKPVEMVTHGWRLVQLMTSVSGINGGGPSDADAILADLESFGWIKRHKRELGFAPEILAFGVGGMSGQQLSKADFPCLFGWSATQQLNVFWYWLLKFSPAHVHGDTNLEAAMRLWPGIHPSKRTDPDNT